MRGHRAQNSTKRQNSSGAWHRPVEAADVVADVEQARQAHVEPLRQVEAQSRPSGFVVAGPCLAVAGNTRSTATGDHMWAFARRIGGLRLVGELVHQERLGRAGEALREGPAVAGPSARFFGTSLPTRRPATSRTPSCWGRTFSSRQCWSKGRRNASSICPCIQAAGTTGMTALTSREGER